MVFCCDCDSVELFTGDGLILGLIPLFHSSFLPDLMHVKVLLPATDLIPTLLHLAPALTAAFAGTNVRDRESENIDKKAISLLFTYRE
jgi:hypothetical protein